MRRSILLLPLLFLVGCGGAAKHAAQPATLIPASKIRVPPQTAVHPDGYAPKAPPKGFTLQGSQIHLSHNGAVFIESFEGWASCPYWDAYGGVWTRGYGETEGIHGGSACISRSFGERNLIYRAERFYGWAIKGLGVSFNQNQADALFSFTWNLGAGIFTGSLRYQIQHHNPYGLLAYVHAGGVTLAGLVRRRRAEVALFLKPAQKETPAQRKARVHRERVARLHADYRTRRSLDKALAGHRCLNGYQHLSRDTRRKCTVWRAKHGAVNRDILRLRRLLR